MSKVAIFIHGIAEGPAVFSSIAEAVRAQDIDCMMLTLPGHGGSCRDFASTDGSLWLKSVTDAVSDCENKYDEIILVGHSLGTLLAILSAEVSPKICGMVLLNSPLSVRVSPRAVRVILTVGLAKSVSEDSVAYPASNAMSVEKGKIWEYIGWLPRLRDLFRYIDKARKALPGVSKPLLIFHSNRDELMGAKCLRLLKELSPAEKSEVIELKNSTHFSYPDDDFELLLSRLIPSVRDWH